MSGGAAGSGNYQPHQRHFFGSSAPHSPSAHISKPSSQPPTTMATNGATGAGDIGLPSAPARLQQHNNSRQHQPRHHLDYGAPESMSRLTIGGSERSAHHTHGDGGGEQLVASDRAPARASEAIGPPQHHFNCHAAARHQQQESAAGSHSSTSATRTRPLGSSASQMDDLQAAAPHLHHLHTQKHAAFHQDPKQQSQMSHHLHHHQARAHSDSSNSNNNNNHQHHTARPAPDSGGRRAQRDQSSCPCDRQAQGEDQDYEQGPHEPRSRYEQLEQQDHYANQLRKNQLQQCIGLHNQRHYHHQQPQPPSRQQSTYRAPSSSSSSSSSSRRQHQVSQQQPQHQQPQLASGLNMGNNTHTQQQQPQPQPPPPPQPQAERPGGARESLHVNFNRSSQKSAGFALGQGGGGNEDDDESGETTRKKKYLTAKYGQQQMNLIKKRLKVEMWLHEQLQELAKQSDSVDADELDEIDIDLDQLLDMDDDQTRRHWLKKLLAPLSGLPSESVDKFVGDVLEQSRLL